MGKITLGSKEITKGIPVGAPYARTQYRNTYQEVETRTVTTGSGYTSSKNGYAEAAGPAPSAGEEYVSFDVSTIRVTNGGCYDTNVGGQSPFRGTPGVANSPLRPTSGFAILLHRNTGGSCVTPNFSASIEMQVRVTKQTKWYYTQAQADAEHTGTPETQTVTTAKHIVSITRDNDGKKISLT